MQYRTLEPGDPAPWFVQRSTSNENYHIDTAAGRYLVLSFFGSALAPDYARVERLLAARRTIFEDTRFAFFGITNDVEDERQQRLRASLPGIRYFWDFDASIGRLYGSSPLDDTGGTNARTHRSLWIVIDPMLRVAAVLPFHSDERDVAELMQVLDALTAPGAGPESEMQAPVLYLPGVLEPGLCAELIAGYERGGGEDSGFMREVDGKTVLIVDYTHKRRMDRSIAEEGLRRTLWSRFERRIFPEIRKAFQFKVTRMERFLVACYEAEQQAHFRPHRDNTTAGTAHRRFAVTLNLNAGYDGGDLYFPEFGNKRYRPAVGGAIVFSCSLLHAVDPMKKGRRFAFLPFLYDDAAARQRLANNVHLGPDVPVYASPTRPDGARDDQS